MDLSLTATEAAVLSMLVDADGWTEADDLVDAVRVALAGLTHRGFLSRSEDRFLTTTRGEEALAAL